MITVGEKWYYLAVKILSTLFRGITSNQKEDVYRLNCFHSYSTKEKLKKHKKYVTIIIIALYKCLKKIIKY